MSAVETTWPPRSPYAALLSSPSGRRKFQQNRDRQERSLSPTKHSTTVASLQQASRKLLDNDEDLNGVDELEDDEETLQLKLAAIEAKLKLKKLQQNRTRVEIDGPGKERLHANRPQDSTSNISIAKRSPKSHAFGSQNIEVPVSPTKRLDPRAEQRSPNRVLLGIDKGMKATDVSLRRARNIRVHGALADTRTDGGVAAGRGTIPGSEFFQESRPRRNVDLPIKTFSERMTANRAQEQSQEKRREALTRKRASGFKLNSTELESLKKAAEEARTHNPPLSPLKDRQRATFTREDVLRSRGGCLPDPSLRKRMHTLPNRREDNAGASSTIEQNLGPSDTDVQDTQPLGRGHQKEGTAVRERGDPSLYDPFSQLHLSSRILPHSFLERTFPSDTHACLRLPQLLKQVTAPAYELPGLEAKDVVIVGVIASKSTPLDHKQRQGTNAAANVKSSNEWEHKWEDGSQNQKRFMVLQLSDLAWSIDLYLFGTALPKYHRLSPGTVVAILNPGIMPPRKGKEDTGAFSLTLHHGDDTLLEIGTARDLGFCVALKKDGQECGSWVNLVKTEVCEWHLNAQITKTQAGRMGVNTGSNAIGRDVSGSRLRNRLVAGARDGTGSNRGLQSRSQGYNFDLGSQSRYFMTPSNETQRKMNCANQGEIFERSAVSLMEADDDNDPFVAEGRLSRDTESRLKKRLLNEEKEREIALKLASRGPTGAGSEYLRHRIAPSLDGTYSAENATDETRRKKSAMATKDNIMMPGNRASGKRAADSVRLSPMKKTRFLTEKGIREAGRESLGVIKVDQDDDLDII